MSKNLKTLLFLSFLFVAKISIACSCERIYFCDYTHFDEDEDFKILSFRAKVLETVIHPDSTNAVYLEVLEKYRDDEGVGSFIKLYGDDGYNGTCYVNMPLCFTPNTEVFIVIGLGYDDNSYGRPFTPWPDNGSYWEFAPILCHFIPIYIDEEVVRGRITEDIQEYPKELFLESLEDCDYNEPNIDDYLCADEDYLSYPNPSYDGDIYLRNNYRNPPITLVRVFNTEGKFITQHSYGDEPTFRKKINIQEKGLFFVEIHCGKKKHTEKVIVL